MTSLLTPLEVEGMRAALHLPDTVSIRRASLVSDAQGGHVETWTTVATTAARVAPATQRGDAARPRVGAVQTVQRWNLTAPATVDVRPHDIVVCGSRTWRVQSVEAPRSDQLCVRAELEEAR